VRKSDHGLSVRRKTEKITFAARPQRQWFAKYDPRTSAVLVGYTTEHGEVGTAIINPPTARTFIHVWNRIKINSRVNPSIRQRQFECLCSEAYWMLRVTGEFNPEQFSWTSIRSSADAAESLASLDGQVN